MSRTYKDMENAERKAYSQRNKQKRREYSIIKRWVRRSDRQQLKRLLRLGL